MRVLPLHVHCHQLPHRAWLFFLTDFYPQLYNALCCAHSYPCDLPHHCLLSLGRKYGQSSSSVKHRLSNLCVMTSEKVSTGSGAEHKIFSFMVQLII